MKLFFALALCILLVGCSETHVAPQSGEGSLHQAGEPEYEAGDRETDQHVGAAQDPEAPPANAPPFEVPPEIAQDAGGMWPDEGAGGEVDASAPRDTSAGASVCVHDRDREPRTLTVPTDYATIQEAIDAAAALDTVSVLPGTYSEHLVLKTGVRLIGSGAKATILDSLGEARTLIDFTDANAVVVSGFTLRNVGRADGCATPDDALACSGNWYAAAVYAAGDSVWSDSDPCNDASISFSDNVVIGNHIGMMVSFGPHADVRNNVFAGNQTAFAATSHGGATGLVAHNIFYDNDEAIAADASFIDIVDNAFTLNRSVLRQDHCQEGRLRCNMLWDNAAIGDRFVLGIDDNIEADPLIVGSDGTYDFAPDSPAIDRACAADPEPVVYDVCSYSAVPLGLL